MYELPAPLVDMPTLPPPLMTSELGSFAYNTFKVRVPRIIDDIISTNQFPGDILDAMQKLGAEIVNGEINPLREHAPDVAFWNSVSSPWFGHTWLDVPWYWAETYLYRRILEATSYFQQGNWHQKDPYTSQKTAELAPGAAPSALQAMLQYASSDPTERFETLLHASLWGNRTDLSYNVANNLGPAKHHAEERENLLVDNTPAVWDRISSDACQSLAMITDNAGTELFMDLALIDFLLSSGTVRHVTMHLKPQPFFVSDAMPKDVHSTIQTISNCESPLLHDLGERLTGLISTNRLQLSTHWFYPTCLFYFQLPDDLRAELAQHDLVILKGDANYRRLLGDAHWPPTASYSHATQYFPAPLVALRTLKAELIVGLSPGMAEKLTAADPTWRVNGKRGVIQANL